eukprot:3458051-Rhodomonas_salina.1
MPLRLLQASSSLSAATSSGVLASIVTAAVCTAAADSSPATSYAERAALVPVISTSVAVTPGPGRSAATFKLERKRACASERKEASSMPASVAAPLSVQSQALVPWHTSSPRHPLW